MIREMLDDPYSLKDILISQLSRQKKLLAHYPRVFCTECLTRGVLTHKKYFTFVTCRCADDTHMITGVDKVIGLICDPQEPRLSGGRYYYPIWDAEQKKPVPGQVDGIQVDANFSGDLNWALTAVLEAQTNAGFIPKRGLKVVVPEGIKLMRNTEMILKEKNVSTTTHFHQI